MGATGYASAFPARSRQHGLAIGRGLRALDYAPPIVAFIGASLLLYAAACFSGDPFFSAVTWFHWDSYLYLQIAQKGYSLARCPKPYLGPLVTDWCGDAGWFPGYPALQVILLDLGVHPVGGAVSISWIFDAGTLLLVWNAFLRRLPPIQGYLGIIFVACCPGGVYMRAAFPMSMTVFFLFLCLWGLRTKRWRWAGAAGGAGAACYPTACLVIPLAVLWILAEDPRPEARRLLAAGECAGLILIGLFGALGFDAAKTGYLKSYFVNQAHYQHGLWQPFHNLWPLIHAALITHSGLIPTSDYEALLAACLVVGLLIGTIVLALRGQVTRWDLLLCGYGLIFWLFPGTQAAESWWRGDTLLVPIVLLMVRMRTEVLVVMCLATVAVFPFLATEFFTGGLI